MDNLITILDRAGPAFAAAAILALAIIWLGRRFDDIGGRLLGLLGERTALSGRRQAVATESTPEELRAPKFRTFYYRDNNQVDDLFTQVSEAYGATEVVTEVGTVGSGGIKARFKVLEAGKDRTNEERTRKTISPLAFSYSRKYCEAEALLFESGDVCFGLETYDPFADGQLEEFFSVTQRLEEEFDFRIPESLRREYETTHRGRQALVRLAQIKAAKGFVVLTAEYRVERRIDAGMCLTFVHPLSADLDPQEREVRFKIPLAPDGLTPVADTNFSDGVLVKSTCVGKILRWDEELHALIILPVALY